MEMSFYSDSTYKLGGSEEQGLEKIGVGDMESPDREGIVFLTDIMISPRRGFFLGIKSSM